MLLKIDTIQRTTTTTNKSMWKSDAKSLADECKKVSTALNQVLRSGQLENTEISQEDVNYITTLKEQAISLKNAIKSFIPDIDKID